MRTDSGHDSTGVHEREEADLHQVETRLSRAFATLGIEQVRQCVMSAYSHYDRVRVRTYVVLLAERRAARELRALQQAVGYRSDRSA